MWGSIVSQVSCSCVTSSMLIVYVTLDDVDKHPLCVSSLREFNLIKDYATGKCFIDAVCFIGELGLECLTHLV